MEVTMNKIIEDINLFKRKAIEVQFIVACIVSRLLMGKGVVQEAIRLWKNR